MPDPSPAGGTDLAGLRERVAALARERAPELGLRAERVRAEYVLNWGGFVNTSFRVTDGDRSLHLKLTADPEDRARLRRWRRLRARLEARYHAPPLLGWVDVPGTAYGGLLFEHVAGRAPGRLGRALAREVAPVLGSLHADRELARRLPGAGRARSCLDSYVGTYVHRFAANFELLRAHPPPFLGGGTLEWMEAEAAALERLARGSAAFAEPAGSPVHGDLWPENLLVAPGGGWYVLDWDDLALGDPVLDWATLLGPTRSDLRPAGERRLAAVVRLDPAARARFGVYARAALLDWVVDPLADWLEADVAPEHAARVRAEKERIHREALRLYRQRFP